MNILTKISIVVLVVLVLFASAVFITKATVDPNYKQLYTEQKNRADIDQMLAMQKELANQLLSQQLATAVKDKDDALARLKATQGDYEAKLTAANGKVTTLQVQLDAQKATLADLTKSVAFNDDARKQLESDLNATRKLADQLAGDKRDLLQQLREAKSAGERYAKQVEDLSEKLDDKNRQIEDLQRRGASGGAAVAAVTPAPAGESFVGTITAVKDDMASVNIGSNNGVKKNQKLIIYRDGKLVGYLVVENVEANAAAGIVQDKQSDPAQGDKVTNKL